MDADRFCRVAGRLMGCPAAPYHEAGPRAAAEEICAQHGLECERDDYGNLLVRLQTDPRPRPLVLAAHLDHPGFEIIRPISATRWLARFHGGVPDSFFRRGLRLRLMPGAIPAILGRRAGAEKQFEIHACALPPCSAARGASPRDQPSARLPSEAGAGPPRFTFAVWELADFRARRGRIPAPAPEFADCFARNQPRTAAGENGAGDDRPRRRPRLDLRFRRHAV